MRIRIRGPSGQSTVTLDDATANVEQLRKTIETETSLSSFDIKYGYPPKPLSLESYSPSKLLSELDVKLNGEQLLVASSQMANKEHDMAPNKSTASTNPAASSSSSSYKPSTSHSLKTPSLLSSQSQSSPSEPLSLTRKAQPEMDDPPEIPIPTLSALLTLRIMPDDNSCLFRAISSAFMSDVDAVHELRSIVASTIQSHPTTYNSAVLDNKSPDAYCRWIQTQDAWGGQVELVILAKEFNVEICAVDVQHLRIDKYNESPHLNRCIVVYSGIHYDTVALNPTGSAGLPEHDIKQFSPEIKEEVMAGVMELAGQLRDRHYYTDVAGFKIRCGDCGTIVTGEAGATEHARFTGHYNFGEAED